MLPFNREVHKKRLVTFGVLAKEFFRMSDGSNINELASTHAAKAILPQN
jgi:hypothetical protein